MSSPVNEILRPITLVLPHVTTVNRDLMKAELGTIIYNSTTNKINWCDVDRTVGAGSWSVVTSS